MKSPRTVAALLIMLILLIGYAPNVVHVLEAQQEIEGDAKFRGVVVEPRYPECFGIENYYCVRVEEIIDDPNNILTRGSVIRVDYGIYHGLNRHPNADLANVGDIVEVYASCSPNVCTLNRDYHYIRRLSGQTATVTVTSTITSTVTTYTTVTSRTVTRTVTQTRASYVTSTITTDVTETYTVTRTTTTTVTRTTTTTVTEQTARFIIRIVNYNVPSTAVATERVTLSLTVEYSFSAPSYMAIEVLRQLPDGSWQRIWGRNDVADRITRSGQGSLSFSISFSVPGQPGMYAHRIVVYYHPLHSQDSPYWNWRLADWKYFNIQVLPLQNKVEIINYNAPQKANSNREISVQLTVRYSLPVGSFIAITINQQKPDGSWERVWRNPDYTTERKGEGTLSYSASFIAPSQPGIYKYKIRAHYLDANGEWVVSDEKYFTIDVTNTVILVVKNGETLQYGDSKKTATWRIGLCTEGKCELERGVHRLYVTIEEWDYLRWRWEPIRCSSKEFVLDLRQFGEDRLTVYIEFDERNCNTWIHTDPPGFDVRDARTSDLDIRVEGPYDDWFYFNWLRSLFGWGRIYRYEVVVRNAGGDDIMITSFKTIFDRGNFKEVKQTLKEAPSQDGRINEFSSKVARIALGQTIPVSSLVNLVRAVYLGGGELVIPYSIFIDRLPMKIKNTIEDFLLKRPSVTGGEAFVSLPTIEVRIHGWGLSKAIAPVVLKSGQGAKFEIIVEEERAGSGEGVRPEFVVTATKIVHRVTTYNLLPYWENIANFVLSTELRDYNLMWNSARGSPIPRR
jgi:hypothetical protein